MSSRQENYGSYEDGTVFRAQIMEAIRTRYTQHHGNLMNPMYEMMIWDIVNKISRLAVTPDHLDSIHDIVGYATLYESYVRATTCQK